jgi:ribosomal protein S12 methylthiotransferase
MMRGDFRSRSLEAIAVDVDRMLAASVVELNLIAQDVACYGYDIGKHPLDLLRMLDEKPGKFWVRPFYLHPLHMTDEILDYLTTSQKFCRYLESPIQHISSRLLKRMNRGYDADYLYDMIKRMRAKLPDTTWRTTFIVGFPGETEADFSNLCDFVSEQKIPRAGVFAYSHEDGTPSFKYKGILPQQTIRARQEELTRLINENADEYNRALVGTMRELIVEEYDREAGVMRGRLSCDAPEIDFTVRAPVLAPVPTGFHQVKLTAVDDEGFVGEFTGGADGTRFIV